MLHEAFLLKSQKEIVEWQMSNLRQKGLLLQEDEKLLQRWVIKEMLQEKVRQVPQIEEAMQEKQGLLQGKVRQRSLQIDIVSFYF